MYATNTTGPEAPATPASAWVRHCERHTSTPVTGAVTGTIPEWLNGRLIRNGPGEKRIGNSSFHHLFDGMSLLHMVYIDDGHATYTSRFLESEAYKINHRSNRIIVSEFGTAGVPDPCLSLYDKFSLWFQPAIKRRQTDNCLVNVLQIKDELLAMTELNYVRTVDPTNLETNPEVLQYSQYVSCHRATAHPHVGIDGTVYNLGFTESEGRPQYVILSLKDGKIQNAKIEASVPARWKLNPAYMHSFGITENYFILIESPLAFNALKMFLPQAMGVPSSRILKWNKNEKTRFRIVSRLTGNELKVNYFAPGFFNFHFFNCFEVNGNVVVDVSATSENIIDCLYMANIDKEWNDPSKCTANVQPMRYVLPVENVEAVENDEELLKNAAEAKISREDFLASASAVKNANGDVFVKPVTLSETFSELPRINYKYNTKPYKYGYSAIISNQKNKIFDFDGIAKLNVNSGEEKIWRDAAYFSSEPIFVSTPGSVEEDDGVILSILIHKENPRQLSLIILDAGNMTETARVNFTAEGDVTPTFHGQFISSNAEKHTY